MFFPKTFRAQLCYQVLTSIVQVVHGKLSLVDVRSTEEVSGINTKQTQYKFPIETYTGLDVATAERIKKFEAETKAMLTRTLPDQHQQTARSSLDGQAQSKVSRF